MNDWILPPSSPDKDPAGAPQGPQAEPRPGLFGRKPAEPKSPKAPKPPRVPKPPKAEKPQLSLARLGRRVLISALAALAAGVLLVAGAAVFWVFGVLLPSTPQIPERSALMVVNQQPGMTFQAADGTVIAQRGAKHGHWVTLHELPPFVPQAFLAAEDKRFYQHGPVDLRGIARAAWVNWRAHRTVQGGSTLTQQLAKTLFLTPSQTLTRKLQEAVIADRIEKAMSKGQVLELYLNRIFFGDNAYGLDAAAQAYFGHPAAQLDLGQAALLASLPKAPTRLALTNDMPAALARSRLVLSTMRAQGWITTDQEQAALDHPPVLAPEQPGEGDYGYVLDMAAAQATQIAGAQAPDLVVKLSIDPRLQAAGQALVRDTLATEGRGAGAHQGALVLLAPDGAIKALVGGTDHHLSAFNRATQAQRQPGSSFKPFVYAAAVERGVKPTDIRQDSPVRFGAWAPTNYEGGYRGAVTVAEALAHSINTVAARLTNEVTPAGVAELAHRFGLKSIPDRPELSIALGSYEVNLLELTSGYQVFQQGGQRVEPYLIQSITDTRGDSLFAQAGSAGSLVYDQANAATMVRMMEGVLDHGTGVRAAFGRPAAGKTGTTQNFRDAWFVGFTPDWVCGVWVGNDDGQPTNHITGGELPAEIWRRMMLIAHQDLPVRDFPWLPASEPMQGGPPDDQAETAQPADGQPAGDDAGDDGQAPDGGRSKFYGGLSDDFGHAAGAQGGGQAGPPAEPGREPPPPPDSMGPPPSRGDSQDDGQ